MSTVIKTSPKKMSQDVKRLNELNKELPANVTGLSDAMKRLSVCWEGAAWATFQNEINSELEELSTISSSFAKFVESLNASTTKYNDAEKQVKSRIKRI